MKCLAPSWLENELLPTGAPSDPTLGGYVTLHSWADLYPAGTPACTVRTKSSFIVLKTQAVLVVTVRRDYT